MIIKGTHYKRNQVHYFKKKNDEVHERAGLPSVLEDDKLGTVANEMRHRVETMKPVTRREVVDTVRLSYASVICNLFTLIIE